MRMKPQASKHRSVSQAKFALWYSLAVGVATPLYGQSLSLIDLGEGVSAYGINTAGQITGCAPVSGGTQHAFLYSAGTLTDLGTLGGASSCGYAINVHGDVTGYADTASAAHAFVFTAGTMTDLGTIAGEANSAGVSVNANGDVVGYAFPSTPFAPLVPGNFYSAAAAFSGPFVSGSPSVSAFLYSHGAMTEVDPVNGPEQPSRFALAINDSGEIGVTFVAGCSDLCPFGGALTVSGGTVSTLNDLPGNDGAIFLTVITGINDSGQIVAYGEDPLAYTHGVIYSGGNMIDLGNNTEAFAINSAGDVVGFRLGNSAIGLYGQIGKDMTPLVYGNGAVRPLNMPGAIPTGINDNGWIIANHLTLNHAYVLEPSSVNLAPFGLSFGTPLFGQSHANYACGACTVKLTNNSAATIAVAAIGIAGNFAQTNNCPVSLGAGGVCTITVSYTPTQPDIDLGALTVSAGGTQYATLLTATATIEAQLHASATTVLAGTPFTLNWSATPGSTCTANGSTAFYGAVATSGSRTISEPAPGGNFGYSISCTQSTQSANAQVNVDVTTGAAGGTGRGGGGGGALDAWSLTLLMLGLLERSGWRRASRDCVERNDDFGLRRTAESLVRRLNGPE
jgi:probable HAF family extracellular repeat protein